VNPKELALDIPYRARVARMRHKGIVVMGSDVRIGPRVYWDVSGGGSIIVGDGVSIRGDVHFAVVGELTIGPGVVFNRWVYVSSFEAVTIGADCLVGERVSIHDENHDWRSFARTPPPKAGFVSKPVNIGERAWIGAGAVVLPGVQVGRTAVIAAGSVVTRSVPENEVWGGIPARRLTLTNLDHSP